MLVDIETSNLDPIKIQKKIRLMEELFQFAFEIKKYQLKMKHPELSERELNHRAYAMIEKGSK